MYLNDVKNYLNEFDNIFYEMGNKMFSERLTSDITKDYILCMIPHHKAAIYMCDNLLRYTNFYPLIELANNIKTFQKRNKTDEKNIKRA